MKKFILLSFLTIMSFKSQAQLTVSPRVGLNYTWVGSSPDGFSKEGSESGWIAGVDLRMGQKVYFQPGIHYWTTGTSIASLDDIKNLQTGRASFLKLPANIGIKVINTGLFNVRIHGGGVANKLLKVKAGGVNAASDFNDWQFAANVGAGIDILIFSLDANYEMGITEMYRNSDVSRPNMFNLTVGFKF